MARFADALDRSMETIKRPPPLPIGHYVLGVKKAPNPPEAMNSAKGDYEKLTVELQVIAPSDDVDPDELAEYGNVAGVPMRIDFIFNLDPEETQKFEGSLNRLKSFIGHCGIDVEGGTLGEKLMELSGAQFLGEIKHRPDPNDSEILYNEVGRTAPV